MEKIPDGPTTRLMQEHAKKHSMVIVVPIYEEEQTGVYYNTAAVIDADGTYLGKYRKTHIPQVAGFYEKFFFKPGTSGWPVFETAYCKLGVYICYDRHFPEGWRALALNGAEYIVNPSATVAGLSQYLWKLEQPASAVANGVYIGACNRVGTEAPWNIGRFYGSSYIVDPRGEFLCEASEDRDELIYADMDMEKVREVRNLWQFLPRPPARDLRADLKRRTLIGDEVPCRDTGPADLNSNVSNPCSRRGRLRVAFARAQPVPDRPPTRGARVPSVRVPIPAGRSRQGFRPGRQSARRQ